MAAWIHDCAVGAWRPAGPWGALRKLVQTCARGEQQLARPSLQQCGNNNATRPGQRRSSHRALDCALQAPTLRPQRRRAHLCLEPALRETAAQPRHRLPNHAAWASDAAAWGAARDGCATSRTTQNLNRAQVCQLAHCGSPVSVHDGDTCTQGPARGPAGAVLPKARQFDHRVCTPCHAQPSMNAPQPLSEHHTPCSHAYKGDHMPVRCVSSTHHRPPLLFILTKLKQHLAMLHRLGGRTWALLDGRHVTAHACSNLILNRRVNHVRELAFLLVVEVVLACSAWGGPLRRPRALMRVHPSGRPGMRRPFTPTKTHAHTHTQTHTRPRN